MVVNLHFQFAKKEPKTIAIDVGDKRQGETYWLNDTQRKKVREAYRKVFHRPIDGRVFTFHTGKARPEGDLDGSALRIMTERGIGFAHTFNYESRERYRIVIPRGPRKHLWTNGRRARIFHHRQQFRRLLGWR